MYHFDSCVHVGGQSPATDWHSHRSEVRASIVRFWRAARACAACVTVYAYTVYAYTCCLHSSIPDPASVLSVSLVSESELCCICVHTHTHTHTLGTDSASPSRGAQQQRYWHASEQAHEAVDAAAAAASKAPQQPQRPYGGAVADQVGQMRNGGSTMDQMGQSLSGDSVADQMCATRTGGGGANSRPGQNLYERLDRCCQCVSRPVYDVNRCGYRHIRARARTHTHTHTHTGTRVVWPRSRKAGLKGG